MSFFGCLLLPLAAVLAALARWLLQGRGNLYTDGGARYYVPDPDLGWRVVESGPVSIGLEAIGLLAAYTVVLLVGLVIARRRERRRGERIPGLRALRWTVAALPLIVPVWAFASGSLPEGASERAPSGLVEAPPDSIEGGLAGLPAGTYAAVAHRGTAITAHLSGGGEAFEARFARDIQGTWRGAPADLRQPMSADISVATAAVDTGIELRSKHAREDYLIAAKFPRIRFQLQRLLGARPAADGAVAYSAHGIVELMGTRHRAAVTGTLRAPSAAARQRLGFAAADPILLATAHFEIKISESKLKADAGDFDGDIIPIDVSLVLRRQVEPKK
ncbi:MAG TPA: YceI family protein [Kofleriaceae bacterium]|nr:YceI family protein [Kofleriaceae bacterium]